MEENREKTQEEIDNEYQYDNGFHPKEVILKPDYNFYPKGIYWLLQRTVMLLTKFFLIIPKHVFFGYRVKGKKNKKFIKGTTIVCNHTFQIDALCIMTTLWTKKIYATTLQSNLGFGLVSKYFRAGGAVPIPTDGNLMKRFIKETIETVKSGKNVIVFPEAMLMPYCDHIRTFKPGAFHFAVGNSDRIIILVHTFHKPRGLYKLFRRHKPCIHLNILPPYYIQKNGTRRETINKTCEDVHKIMVDYFNEHSDYFQKNTK